MIYDFINDILDISTIFLGICVLLLATVAILSAIGQISVFIGKPVKWIREKQKDHELVITNAKVIQELSKRHEEDTKQSIRHLIF